MTPSHLAPSPITVRMTPTMGRGVFAAHAIPADEELGVFHTLRLPPVEVVAMAGSTLSHFWFEDDNDGSAFVVFGWIELVNHSLAPNCDRRWADTPEGAVVTLFSNRAIAQGEQLFIDYKFDATARNPAWAGSEDFSV
jgi:SET domain